MRITSDSKQGRLFAVKLSWWVRRASDRREACHRLPLWLPNLWGIRCGLAEGPDRAVCGLPSGLAATLLPSAFAGSEHLLRSQNCS